jgi:hypothetical protein
MIRSTWQPTPAQVCVSSNHKETPGVDKGYTEPDIGELRFIARLDSGYLPNAEPFGECSTTAGSSETVEGSDVVSKFVFGTSQLY